VVGALEAEHEHARAAVARARGLRLARVEQAAVGRREARLRERAYAAAPRAKPCSPAKRTDTLARKRGRSWSRIHASVMMPSAPSEPRNRRSGLGPAPDPGSRRLSLIPAGVTTRIDSTKSSMWV
jgi:hypothetical protein